MNNGDLTVKYTRAVRRPARTGKGDRRERRLTFPNLPARNYGYVSSIEDFADSYSIVTTGSFLDSGELTTLRKVIIEAWINQ
jgi:hypothetical protein